MGKTIALKLTEKEDRIITQLNKQGITNSELLRNSLRQYFECLYDLTTQEAHEKSPIHTEEDFSTVLNKSFQGLKQDLQELQEQTMKRQQQIEKDIATLQNQLHQLCITKTIVKQDEDSLKVKNPPDIHHEVDEFLRKRSQ